MDLNQAMRFIQWDEQRRASQAATGRAEESAELARQKFALSKKRFVFDYAKELRRMREKEIENEKYVISSLIDSYHKARTLGEKNSIRETVRNCYNSLNPSSRKALDPYIRHSPLSPFEEKRKEFLKLYKPPREPSVEDYKDKNYYRIAQFEFDKADFIRREEHFTTGKLPDKTNFIGLSDGVIGVRNERGGINIFSGEEMRIKAISEKYDITPNELLANDGWVTSKESIGSIERDGEIFDVFPRMNYLRAPAEGEKNLVEKYARTAVNPSPIQLPTTTKKLIEDIIGNNETNLVAKNLRERILKSEESKHRVLLQLETNNPGFHFAIESNKIGTAEYIWERFPILGWFIKDEETFVSIAVTQGDQQLIAIPGLKDKKGKPLVKKVWIDRFNIVRNKYGTILGKSPEQAGARIAEAMKAVGR